jgi:hypothetical protein
MRATFEDLVPGKILFTVCCVIGESVSTPRKMIVQAEPTWHEFIISGNGAWFVKVQGFYDEKSFIHEISLQDNGIKCPEPEGHRVYNLHRLYTTIESALSYVDQINNCHITDDEEDDSFLQKNIKNGFAPPEGFMLPFRPRCLDIYFGVLWLSFSDIAENKNI